MALLVISFIAGILTILAPCVLPLLPVIVGGSLSGDDRKPSLLRPIIITASLSVSIILSTLLLKATTVFIGIPDLVLQIISGGLIIGLGIYFLFPQAWYRLLPVQKLTMSSNRILGKRLQDRGLLSAVLVGLALGPVFNSCSPTYAFIVAGILPVSFVKGFIYLIAYVVGLGGALLLVAYGGQNVVRRTKWLTSPDSRFHQVIGFIFILVGVSILLGLDKHLQTFILERGWYDPIGRFEQSLN